MIHPPPLADLARDLIRIPSVTSDTAACKQVIDFCAEFLAQIPGIRLEYFTCNGHSSLVASNADTRTHDVLLQAHLDVVPAPPHCFLPSIDGDLLLGRGAFDMKGQAAALIRAFIRHVQSSQPLTIGLMLTTDEETGGDEGVGYLVEQKGYRPRCVVLPDGGMDFTIVERQYGVVWVKVERKGIAAHTSRPEEGRNAILSFMESFGQLQKRIEPMAHTLLSLSKMEAGEAMNVTPALCTAWLDIRSDHPERIPPLLHEIFDDREYEILIDEPPYRLDIEHPVVRLFHRIAEDHCGRPVPFVTERGSSDARFFQKYDIPVLLLCPRGGRHHQDDEWVDLPSLASYEELLGSFLTALRHETYRTESTDISVIRNASKH